MNMPRYAIIASLAAVVGLGAAAQASATTVLVDAKDNSLYGDSGVHTGINLTVGEGLKVHVDPADIWSAGGVPLWSNANGLTTNLYATGSDESGYAAGILIGQPLGTMQFDNFWATVGSLVGKIGNTYKQLGTDYDGTAWETGELRLFFWDNPSVTYDNKDHITAEITHGFPLVDNPPTSAVPEPASWALMIMGFGFVGASMRRRFGPRVGNRLSLAR